MQQSKQCKGLISASISINLLMASVFEPNACLSSHPATAVFLRPLPCFRLLIWIKRCSVFLCMNPNPFQHFTQHSTTQSSALNYYWVWYKSVALNWSRPGPAPELQQCDPTSRLQTNFRLHELLRTCTLPMHFSLSTSPQGFPGKHRHSLWREQILDWQVVDILYTMMMLLIWLWPESSFILSTCQKWKWKQSYKPFSIT